MYVGGRYDASSTEGIDVEFRCKKCRTTKWARVVATGYGTARSPYFIGLQGARDRAATAAISDAHDIAHTALQFVPCPKCGARSQATSPVALISVVAMPTILGALAAAIALGPDSAWTGAGLGLVMGAVMVWSRRRRAAAVARWVQFFDGEPPDRPYVGKRCAVCDRQIVTASDGRRCGTCGKPVHATACDEKHTASAHGDKAAP